MVWWCTRDTRVMCYNRVTVTYERHPLKSAAFQDLNGTIKLIQIIVPTHNKYSHNKHISHNKHTLFALTKMCLFWEEEDFGKNKQPVFKISTFPKISTLFFDLTKMCLLSVGTVLISKKDAPTFLLSNPCIYRQIRLSLKLSSFSVIFTKWSPGTFSGKNQVLSNPSRFIMLPDDRSSRLPIFSQISAALLKETFSNKMWYFLSLKIETEFVGTYEWVYLLYH